MRSQLPLENNTKLMVIYRLEPDCLGLVGHKQIHEFCHHVTKNILPVDSAFVIWLLLPRLEARELMVNCLIESRSQSILLFLKEITVFLKNLLMKLLWSKLTDILVKP